MSNPVLFAVHLLCYANWIVAPVAAWQGNWWLSLWCLFAALVITAGLILFGAVQEHNRQEGR